MELQFFSTNFVSTNFMTMDRRVKKLFVLSAAIGILAFFFKNRLQQSTTEVRNKINIIYNLKEGISDT